MDKLNPSFIQSAKDSHGLQKKKATIKKVVQSEEEEESVDDFEVQILTTKKPKDKDIK